MAVHPGSGKPLWSLAVTEALRDNNGSPGKPNTIAKLAAELDRKHTDLKFGLSTTKALLSGAIAPDPFRVRAIAEVLGLNAEALFWYLGWVEPGTMVPPTATAREEVEFWNSPIAPLRSGAAVLTDLCSVLDEYTTVTVTLLDPYGNPLRDYVGIHVAEVDPNETDPLVRRGKPTRRFLEKLQKDLGPAFRKAPALLEDAEFYRSKVAKNFPDAQVWYWVPRLMETRPASRESQGLIDNIKTIVVVGGHGAGADDIGAYLAMKLGWGYVNSSFEAQRFFGRDFSDQLTHSRHCVEVASAYLSSGHSHFRVISHGNPATANEVVKLALQSEQRRGSVEGRIAILYAKSMPNLLEYASRVWFQRPDRVIPGFSVDYDVLVAEAFGEGLKIEENATAAEKATREKILAERMRYTIEMDLEDAVVEPFRRLRPTSSTKQYEVDLAPYFYDKAAAVAAMLAAGK